eukprot:CAMPEP_0115136768 /NCGR_PEP_ID=MMETSP0227-20121206/56578_1 /TAXON_ID=89957 /ORGANISM="Polarella glacialis, Strain CCMP 1383" /LENGTH=260 /DNA_ID=CAMNT_0002543881 /DNA_START=13 /DNA_END=793 /DNA_ORIENTATION=-
MAGREAVKCFNPRCSRHFGGDDVEVPLICRCRAPVCSEACWIQAWHAGHQASCPHAAEVLAEAAEAKSRRRGAALLASVALTRRPSAREADLEDKVLDGCGGESQGGSSSSSAPCAQQQEQQEEEWGVGGAQRVKAGGFCIGDFDQTAELGAGACGTVTKVVLRSSGEVFALKAIDRRRVAEHRLQEYIEREVATQRNIDHPNVVKLQDYFEDSDRVYLLLEYACGGQLFSSKIRKEGCLSEQEAARTFADVLRALLHLH